MDGELMKVGWGSADLNQSAWVQATQRFVGTENPMSWGEAIAGGRS